MINSLSRDQLSQSDILANVKLAMSQQGTFEQQRNTSTQQNQDDKVLILEDMAKQSREQIEKNIEAAKARALEEKKRQEEEAMRLEAMLEAEQQPAQNISEESDSSMQTTDEASQAQTVSTAGADMSMGAAQGKHQAMPETYSRSTTQTTMASQTDPSLHIRI